MKACIPKLLLWLSPAFSELFRLLVCLLLSSIEPLSVCPSCWLDVGLTLGAVFHRSPYDGVHAQAATAAASQPRDRPLH